LNIFWFIFESEEIGIHWKLLGQIRHFLAYLRIFEQQELFTATCGVKLALRASAF